MTTRIRFGELTGWHVVVLMFAGWLLAVPLADVLRSLLPQGSVGRDAIGRLLPYVIIAIALLLVRPLRESMRERLGAPVPASAGPEIGLATGLDILANFGWMGAYVLWWHVLEGPVALEQRLDFATHAEAMARAFSVDGMIVALLLAVLLGPVVEELIFRGLLLALWERRYGWTASVLMSSTLFGLYHANFLPAFVGSLIYSSLYTRTRSLKVVMLAHGLHNLLVYYPFLGRFIAPHDLAAPGDLRSWVLHVMALSVAIVAVPLYVWLAGLGARDSRLAGDAALSR